MLRYTTRPISDRTWQRKSDDDRQFSLFKVGWSTALDLLEREYVMLDGEDLVIECDVREQDIRNDGMLRATAKPDTPAVVVAFESKHGPLLYRCDQYLAAGYQKMSGWQMNVYAIAKTLEALRAVDRYGAAESGEQYRGYRQIEGVPTAVGEMLKSPTDAECWLLAFTGLPAGTSTHDLLRAARKKSHPDTGGDVNDWHMTQEAAGWLA